METSPAMVDTTDAVVVTGGLGFIGSFVADAYLELGRNVVIIDSMVSSAISTKPYDDHPNCSVLKVSVEEYFALGGGFEGAERVVHAASLVGPAGILRFAGRLGHDIVHACQLVVEECIKHNVPMVDFSSAEVYGRSGELAEGDTIQVPVDYSD